MKNHISLESKNKFRFAISNPFYPDFKDYLKDAKSEEKELIQSLVSSVPIDETLLLIFKLPDHRIGVLGKAFRGWCIDDSEQIALHFFNMNSLNPVSQMKIINTHPAKGPGYGSIHFTDHSNLHCDILFFMDSTYNQWDTDFQKSEDFILPLKDFLSIKEIKTGKYYNC